MANIAEPQVVINYISQLKKITVNRNNQPSQLIIQTDYNLNETYNFQVINKINQIVELDSNTTYQIYGTYIDAKKQVHILFYTLGVTPRDNMLSFLVNTYTSEYLNYVKSNRTPIDISIVAKQNVGGSTRSYMVLRDTALANPRGYIEGQAPTDIVYQNVFNVDVPVSGVFGAGNNLNLAQDLEGQEIYTFAFGDTLSTNNANQFVIGYNNTPDATKAFIVANSGNIFTVDYEGNVEAGDLNVGAISATAITVSGEDLNQVIDDKVEYLSTSIDDKLSATENWVSDTFETKESATQAFNELEGDIGQISAFISGLPTDIAAKADQTDLEALSGTVEGLAETKADKTELTAYIEKSASGLFATSGQMTELSTYVQGLPTSDTTYTGVAPIVVDATTHEISLEGEVGQTYYAGTGLALDDQTNTFSLTGTVLSGDGTTIAITDNVISVIGGAGSTYQAGNGINIEDGVISAKIDKGLTFSNIGQIAVDVPWLNDKITGFNYITGYTAGNGIDIQNGVISAKIDTNSNSIAAKAAGLGINNNWWLKNTSGFALKSQIEDFVTEQDVSGVVESMSATIIDGLATESFVTTQGYQTATNVSDYFASVSGDVVAAATGAITVPTNEQISGIASAVVEDLSTTIRSGLASTNDIPTTVAELTDAGNYALTSDIKTYQAGTGLALSSDNETFYLTGTVLQGDNTTIAINNNVISVIGGGSGGGGKVYQGVSGISVDNNPQIGQIALTAHIPDSAEISGIAEDVVEGLSTTIRTGLAATEQIPTTVAELTDSSDYALKTDLNDYIEKSVSGQFATSGELEALTQTVNGKADSSAIPTKTSDLQNDSQFATSGQVSAIVTGYNYITSADIPAQYVTETELGTALADYTKTADLNIPTNADISGIAEDVVEATSAAIVGTITVPTKTSDLTNDSDFATSAYVQEASGHAVDVATGWVDGKGYLVQADLNGYAQTSDIPTAVSELTNDKNYLSSIALSAYNASTMQNEVVQTTGINLASSDFVTWNGEVYVNENKYAKASDIPTNTTTSAQVSAIVTGYLESEDRISAVGQLINDVGYITGYTAGTGIDINNGVISCTVQGGGGGGGGSQDLSDYNNDVPFITAEDITNKQRVSTVNGATITYDSAFEVFKTTYTGGDVTLNTVTATTSQIGNGEIATFEEWITFSSAVTSISEGSSITLIGEWPSQIDNTKTHVLVRRLVNNAGTITQYVSYAYNF